MPFVWFKHNYKKTKKKKKKSIVGIALSMRICSFPTGVIHRDFNPEEYFIGLGLEWEESQILGRAFGSHHGRNCIRVEFQSMTLRLFCTQ
jgi:hypothetical protein